MIPLNVKLETSFVLNRLRRDRPMTGKLLRYCIEFICGRHRRSAIVWVIFLIFGFRLNRMSHTSIDGVLTIGKNGVLYTQHDGRSNTYVRFKTIERIEWFPRNIVGKPSRVGEPTALTFRDATGRAALSIPRSDFTDFEGICREVVASWTKFWSV